MRREIIDFKLENGDECHTILQELNHKVYAINTVIQLKTININPSCFQEIIDYIITNLYDVDINKIFFDQIRFKYRIIGFNLFGQCRASFKNKMQEHVLLEDLKSKKISYSWIQPAFLPKFDPDTDTTINLIEKKPHNVFKVFHKGNYNGVSYNIDKNYTVQYNYYYDVHPTDLIPVFDTHIKITNVYYQPNDVDIKTKKNVDNYIQKLFKEFDIKLMKV